MIHLTPIAEFLRTFTFVLSCVGLVITCVIPMITNRVLDRSFQLALATTLLVSLLLMVVFDILGL